MVTLHLNPCTVSWLVAHWRKKYDYKYFTPTLGSRLELQTNDPSKKSIRITDIDMVSVAICSGTGKSQNFNLKTLEGI